MGRSGYRGAFSLAGLRDRGWGKTKQYSGQQQQQTDDLFFEFIRLLKEIRPKTFVAENVFGLKAGKARGYLKEIYEGLVGAGYNVTIHMLDAVRLGIPQKRKRLIFVGTRNDLPTPPSAIAPLDVVTTLEQAIEGLPPAHPALEDFYDTPVGEREYEHLKEGTRTRFAWEHANVLVENGSFRAAYLKQFNSNARWNWFKLPPNQPCPTITGKVATLIRWDIPRTLSIGEAKRLSTFPDDWVSTGSFKKQWERIGRAVPPVMMGFVADMVAKQIFGVGGLNLGLVFALAR